MSLGDRYLRSHGENSRPPFARGDSLRYTGGAGSDDVIRADYLHMMITMSDVRKVSGNKHSCSNGTSDTNVHTLRLPDEDPAGSTALTQGRLVH